MTVTVSTKGQVVLPVELRRKLGLKPGSVVDWELTPDGGGAVLRPLKKKGKTYTARELVGMLPNNVGPTTFEQMNEAIDEAFRKGEL